MSNLKSKFLLGVMTVAIMFVGVVAVQANTAAAATCTITSTLKVGSKGAQVMCLQSALGLTADGSFGPKTKAAVKAWQASNGLTADGVFGAKSRAAFVANGGVSGNFPAGCQSASGFSATTGLPCNSVNANTFPAGCTSASGFSTTTGQPCNSSNFPAGCTSAAGFSSTTGQSCSGTTTTTGPLTGGAGDITVTSTTTDVEDQVIEGASNTKVLGFKVEATGSDVAVTNLKVSLQNRVTTTASYRLPNVASEVAVWEDGVKVGSALVSDFSKDTNTTFTANGGANVYSKSIALTNAVVRSGSANKKTFYVTVTALPNIDTNDMTSDSWAILVNNIRFQDATGVVMTSSDTVGSATSGAFEFATLASSGDAKVVISKNSSSPTTQEVTVTTSGSTKNVLLLAFNVKTTGTSASFDTLSVTTALTTTNANQTYTNLIGDLSLRDSSTNEIASLDGSVLDGTETFTLDNTYTVPADSTKTFYVYATLNDASNYATGASLSVSLPSGTAMNPEDANGNVIVDTGSASGSAQTFVFDVPTISLTGTPTLSLFSAAHDSVAATYKATIDFNVTAPDNATIYVPLDSFAYGTAGTAGVLYTKTGGATVTSAAVTYAGSDNVTSITEANSYRVDAGTTQKFELNVYLTGNNANGKIALTGLWYETAQGTPDGTPTVSGLTNLYTPLVYLGSGL